MGEPETSLIVSMYSLRICILRVLTASQVDGRLVRYTRVSLSKLKSVTDVVSDEETDETLEALLSKSW